MAQWYFPRLVDVAWHGAHGSLMAQAITQREFGDDSGEIVRRLDQGETFVITRNGTPMGELTPLRRHRFVATDTVIAVFRNAPGIDAARFRADLDAVVAQATYPRGCRSTPETLKTSKR